MSDDDNVVKLVTRANAAKDEAVALGIAHQQARDFFHILGMENTRTDPAERLAQTERYERARANMYEAMNKHQAALARLGKTP